MAKRFSLQEDQFLKDHYLRLSGNAIGKILSRNPVSIYQRYSILGLIVPGEIKKNLRIGKIPANKGKTWSEWMSREGIENSKKSLFKKGHTPKHKHDLFTIKIRNCNNGRIPVLVIFLDAGPKLLHRYL